MSIVTGDVAALGTGELEVLAVPTSDPGVLVVRVVPDPLIPNLVRWPLQAAHRKGSNETAAAPGADRAHGR